MYAVICFRTAPRSTNMYAVVAVLSHLTHSPLVADAYIPNYWR